MRIIAWYRDRVNAWGSCRGRVVEDLWRVLGWVLGVVAIAVMIIALTQSPPNGFGTDNLWARP